MNQHPVIRLRAIEPEDLDVLYRIENDRTLWNVGATNVPYSRYTLHDYVATSSDDIYADRQVRLVIENAEGETVGMADIVRFDPQHLRAEVGIVIIDAYRRRGYARLALADLCSYALDVLHLHQLYAIIDVRNETCLQLFRQMGYHESSRLKDWLYDGREYRDAIVMQTFF